MMELPMRDSVATFTEASPVAVLDVGAQLESARLQDPAQTGKDRTVILLKTDSLRVIFRSFSEGASLPTHKAPGPITVQVLEGHIEFTAGTRTTPVRKGEVLALESEVPHSVKSLSNSAILITVLVRPQSS
jgi:quercetin dioxygenase-like cupin family protein